MEGRRKGKTPDHEGSEEEEEELSGGSGREGIGLSLEQKGHKV